MTTRAPRSGEKEGISYYFRKETEFRELIQRNAFLEYAQVYDHFYGTPKKYVLDQVARGKTVLLEIDIQGAMQVKKTYPKGVFIYIVPPSLQILSQRIHDRGTDSEEVIQKRLSQITRELALAHQYDYIIVNDVLEQAVRKTSAILEAERCKLSRNEGQIETIFKQYITKEVSSK
jgi:guanylate kinase